MNNNINNVQIKPQKAMPVPGKVREVDDINMHVFNLKDENITEMEIDDRMNIDKFTTRN